MKIDSPKISVIMPSYLGEYENAASNREAKFFRAVESFLAQSYGHKELVIVSDGCDITDRLYSVILGFAGILSFSSRQPEQVWDSALIPIKLVRMPKQPLFSGAVRNMGIKHATGDIIAYLDTDDIIQPHHCENLVQQMGDNDWVYYDDWVATESSLRENALRGNSPVFGHLGTSAIAHRRKLIVGWCDGYGHDFKFIEDLLVTSTKFKKIWNCGYVVCHVVNRCDF